MYCTASKSLSNFIILAGEKRALARFSRRLVHGGKQDYLLRRSTVISMCPDVM
jgi:hypothetical protein